MPNFIEALLNADPEGQREMVRARLRVAVTERLLVAMEDGNVSKAELAQRIGVTRSAVTQALSSRNLSLNTLADMAQALELRVEVQFTPTALVTPDLIIIDAGATRMAINRSPMFTRPFTSATDNLYLLPAVHVQPLPARHA